MPTATRTLTRRSAASPEWLGVGELARVEVAVAVALLTGLVGLFASVGADARWLAALGRSVLAVGHVPVTVPFAAAASPHWANPLVLAEIVFDGLEAAFGDRGLVLAQLLATGIALSVLARDGRAGGASPSALVGALVLAVVGAFPSLAIARVQLFSLVLFPLLVALLRAEARTPSWRIWLAVPLLALWSNLHGAVLLGLATLLGYLLLARLRQTPLTAVAVAVAGAAALCLTPAGLHTVSYLHGLVTNLAAQRGVGQWAPLGSSPFDAVAVAAAVALGVKARERRPALWELAVGIGLLALTVKAARDDVWLLFYLVGPASRRRLVPGDLTRFVLPCAALAIVLLAAAALRAPTPTGASRPIVLRAIALAHGSPILADGIPAEQVALGGGRIWAGNPLDAFDRAEQARYLDWLAGAPAGLAELRAAAIRIVLVSRGSAAEGLTLRAGHFAEVAGDAGAVILERRGPR